MVAGRRGKRKNSPAGLVFEVDDEDVSPDNSEDECPEPEAKVLKNDPKLVESVVNALSNLENEKTTETKGTELSNVQNETLSSDAFGSQSEEITAKEILGCITPNVNFSENIEDSQNECEDGELSVDVDAIVDKTDSPNETIQIIFSSQNVSQLYKEKFVNFLNTFIELELIKDDALSITVQKNWQVVDETTLINESVPDIKNDVLESNGIKNKKKKRKKTKKEKELFILDTMPSEKISIHAKYQSKFNIDVNDDDNNEEGVKAPVQTCFNCDKNHSLKDCPEPKNYNKINMMRQKHKDKWKTSRYHLEEDQKYAHLTPGKISDTLREALGLKKNQIPPYIYRMRVLGYSPGWLEEAKFVYSNLSMFDSEGKDVKPDNKKKNLALDAEKIIEYPGFNVPMGDDCIDEYKDFGVYPYSESCSKKAMIEYFQKEYSKEDNFESEDMDIDSNEMGCDEKLPDKDKKPNVVDENVTNLTLVDLVSEKEKLLAALDENSSSMKSDVSENDKQPILSSTKEDIQPGNDKETPLLSAEDNNDKQLLNTAIENNKQTSLNTTVDNEPLQSADAALSEMFPNEKEPESKSEKSMAVLNSTFGTPILKSSSPYSRLPNPDNFMKDVSPVINFENLPNSTGKYEQMTGILQKVRSTLKSIHKSDLS